MEFDRVHFYVEDALTSRNWFIDQLGFQAIASEVNHETQTEVVCSGRVYFFLSSPLSKSSPAAHWLKLHPPGVADVAFRVKNLESVLKKAVAAGAKLLEPMQQIRLSEGTLKRAKIAGWGDVTHTLSEAVTDFASDSQEDLLREILAVDLESTTSSKKQKHNLFNQPLFIPPSLTVNPSTQSLSHSSVNPALFRLIHPQKLFTQIDHVVLNVEAGDLEAALNWYQTVLGFEPQQDFKIQTNQSALRSRVMLHPDGGVKLPINEPASANSQIQEFLEVNQGPGIQHIALQTENILQVVRELRPRGLSFLTVPSSYYQQVRQQWGQYLAATEWETIEACQILVDCQGGVSEGMLLQIFTQPIFEQPTFFFELIERRIGWVNGEQIQAQGFGEGNFRALFEAIEREQLKRGSLGG